MLEASVVRRESQGCQFGRLFKIGINAEIDLRGFPWIGVRYRAS